VYWQAVPVALKISCCTAKIMGANAMGRKRGIVKWFNRLKGFGFIEPEEGGSDVFVHYSAIDGDGYRNLQEGDQVGYDPVDQGKGPQARNVRR
jgi:CspA family cold shock protein